MQTFKSWWNFDRFYFKALKIMRKVINFLISNKDQTNEHNSDILSSSFWGPRKVDRFPSVTSSSREHSYDWNTLWHCENQDSSTQQTGTEYNLVSFLCPAEQ